jgi:hypothetical protein
MHQNTPKKLWSQRASLKTDLTLPALNGYLQRECGPYLFNADTWVHIK